MSVVTRLQTSVIEADEKKDLLKRTICKGSSDEELELFSLVCKKTGLDPFMKQIYPVKRWDNKEKKFLMTMQTSIDGFRLIAERTGNYSPGREPSYQYDENKNMISSTAYVKKRTSDGMWHEVAATAYYEEYVQKYQDRESKKWEVGQFWGKMPHVMLAKCAESLALRKAFPAELSGIYTQDEMSQADSGKGEEKVLTGEHFRILEDHLHTIGDESVREFICKRAGIDSIYCLQTEKYAGVISYLENLIKEKKKKGDLKDVCDTE